MMEWLKNIDWQTVGALITSGLAIIGTITIWLRKNMGNFEKIKNDSTVTSESIKYSKANMQSNKELRMEIMALKKEVHKFGLLVNSLNKTLAKEEKKDEV